MGGLFALPSMCSSNQIKTDPIGQLVKENGGTPQFTILLYDTEKTGVFSKEYKHKYRLIKKENGRVVAKDTKWFPIGSSYYNQHENNVGMEVAAKDTTGRVKRVVGPPGYTNYIGQAQYGYWTSGINDTVLIQEKVVDTSAAETRLTYYDYPTKSTAIVTTNERAYWLKQFSNKLPNDFVADTAYVKDNLYRKATGSAEQQALAGAYYWKFYPHQAYISTLLQLPTGKIKLSEHQRARERYHRGMSYYGILMMGGNRRYGTYSSHSRRYSSGKRFGRGGGGFGK
ncbi:MAG: hypothetical protein AB8E82_14385 [Aureispira sp.]